MKYGLDGKTVILTGASGGFGSEITRILTEKHGCKVIGIGRSEEKMRELKKSLGDKGDLFTYVLFDITDGEKWRSFAENLTGTPDIMINCAGILPPFAAIEKQTMGNTEHTMRVNFLSHATAIDTMLPYIMKATDPMIVNIVSSSALCPVAGAAAYSASKAAFKSYSEALRAEMIGKVRVFTVCPGFSMTGIFRSQTEKMPERSVMKYFSTPPGKIAKKTVRGMAHGRKRMTCGFDARLMDIGHRLAPSLTVRLMRYILIRSGEPMFKDI